MKKNFWSIWGGRILSILMIAIILGIWVLAFSLGSWVIMIPLAANLVTAAVAVIWLRYVKVEGIQPPKWISRAMTYLGYVEQSLLDVANVAEKRARERAEEAEQQLEVLEAYSVEVDAQRSRADSAQADLRGAAQSIRRLQSERDEEKAKADELAKPTHIAEVLRNYRQNPPVPTVVMTEVLDLARMSKPNTADKVVVDPKTFKPSGQAEEDDVRKLFGDVDANAAKTAVKGGWFGGPLTAAQPSTEKPKLEEEQPNPKAEKPKEPKAQKAKAGKKPGFGIRILQLLLALMVIVVVSAIALTVGISKGLITLNVTGNMPAVVQTGEVEPSAMPMQTEMVEAQPTLPSETPPPSITPQPSATPRPTRALPSATPQPTVNPLCISFPNAEGCPGS